MKRIPPAHPLYHAKLQCDGAKQRLDALKKRIGRYKNDPFRFAAKKENGKIEAHWPRPIPDTWGTVIFQFADGLRSSLNYIAWELAKKHLNGEREPRYSTQFPICDTPGDARGGFGYQLTRQIADVLPAAIQDIDYFQPYHRPDRPDTHLLAILREMSNSTKHRFIIQPQGRPWAVIEGPAQIRIRRLHNGDFQMVVTRTNAAGLEEEFKPTTTFEIGIEIPTLFPTQYDISVLDGIYDIVRNDILPRFINHF